MGGSAPKLAVVFNSNWVFEAPFTGMRETSRARECKPSPDVKEYRCMNARLNMNLTPFSLGARRASVWTSLIGIMAVALVVGGCSAGGGSARNATLGFGDSGQSRSGGQGGGGLFSDLGALFGGSSDDGPQQHAGLQAQDNAPEGSWRKAPSGALADRDYGNTALNAENALGLINDYRAEHGLGPVTMHPLLVKAAKSHSTDLAKHDRISHYGSDGSNPWDRVQRAGYKARVAAENVGTGQTTIDEVMRGWMESEAHNRNLLLNGAEHAGIALVRDERTEFKTFWTLVLGAEL